MARLKNLIFWFAILSLVFWIAWTSPTFKECVQNANEGYSQNALQEHIAPFYVLLIGYRLCIGEFIHISGESIIALFTIILGIATWFLWQATRALVKDAEASSNRIWEAGEKQRKISEDAVAAAREANEIIRSEQRPWVLYFDQVNWYRLPQEFNEATQEYGWPPAYRINLFKYGVRGAISFENYGKLPAYHVGMEVKPFFQQTGLPIPIPNWEDEVLLRDMNSIIAPSGHQSINCTIDAYNLGQMSRKVIDVFWFIRIWYCTNETIKPEIGSKDIRQTIYGFRITFESEGTLIGQSELVPVLRLHPIKGYSSAN